mgnify:CR=1 FL=1
MNKYFIIIALAIVLLFLAACATNTDGAAVKMVTKYDIALTKVNRLDENIGKAKAPVADTTLVDKVRYRYEDDIMRTIWSATENGFEITLYNPTDKIITIDWDGGQYLDYDNIGHRLLISKTKDADKDKPQTPSVVSARGNMVETITSADHVKLSSVLGLYVREPLLPTDYASAVRYNGKEMKLMLPITIDGVTHRYEHIFKVVNVRQIAAKSTGWFGL